MRMRVPRAGVVLAAALFAVRCGSSSPVGPSSGLDGSWAGVLARGTDRGSVTLHMNQTESGVSGTWAVDFDGASGDRSGSVGGTVIGVDVTLFLTPAAPLDCAGVTLSGTLTVDASMSGDRLTGTYLGFTCDGVDTGTLDVTRN